MSRTSQLHHGWTIDFEKHVHMYCHRMMASKGGREISVPCEDLPEGDGLVGLWLYDLGLDEATRDDLLAGLLAWAKAVRIRCRIYTSREYFETHEPGR